MDLESSLGSPQNKRLITALVLGTLVVVAFFLAQGTTQLLAASLLPLDRSATALRAGRPQASARVSVRERDDTTILRRNIFDSETGPLDGTPVSEVPVAEPLESTEELDPNSPPPTCEGSVRLVASVVNPRRQDWSFAAIIGAAGKAMLYRVGQQVDGRQVLQILPHRVILRPASSGPCQIAMFNEDGAPTAPARPAVSQRTPPRTNERIPPNREGAISNEDLEAGITRNSDTNFTIQRSLVDRILENQAELMRTARIIPHEEGGRVVGVKVYGIRRNSLLGRLGVQNGDMLRTINGYDMSSPDSALEAYTRLRSADHLTLSIVRRGQSTTLDYNIQ